MKTHDMEMAEGENLDGERLRNLVATGGEGEGKNEDFSRTRRSERFDDDDRRAHTIARLDREITRRWLSISRLSEKPNSHVRNLSHYYEGSVPEWPANHYLSQLCEHTVILYARETSVSAA